MNYRSPLVVTAFLVITVCLCVALYNLRLYQASTDRPIRVDVFATTEGGSQGFESIVSKELGLAKPIVVGKGRIPELIRDFNHCTIVIVGSWDLYCKIAIKEALATILKSNESGCLIIVVADDFSDLHRSFGKRLGYRDAIVITNGEMDGIEIVNHSELKARILSIPKRKS